MSIKNYVNNFNRFFHISKTISYCASINVDRPVFSDIFKMYLADKNKDFRRFNNAMVSKLVL